MTMTYVPDVIEHPSPNYSPRQFGPFSDPKRGRPGTRVDTVLIHHTASDDDLSTLRWLCSVRSGVSAHYLVGTEGRIWRLVPESMKAWHAGKGRLPWEKGPWTLANGKVSHDGYDFNHRSIGIEIVNPGDGKTPFTEAQYRALAWLVPDIVRRLSDGRPAFTLPRGEEVTPGWMGTAMKLMRDGRVVVLGHRDVAPGRKTDPADNFDWGRIRAALAGGTT